MISYKNRYIYTIGGDKVHTNAVTVYDTKNGTFNSKAPLRKTHNSIHCARIRDKIFAVDVRFSLILYTLTKTAQFRSLFHRYKRMATLQFSDRFGNQFLSHLYW